MIILKSKKNIKIWRRKICENKIKMAESYGIQMKNYNEF